MNQNELMKLEEVAQIMRCSTRHLQTIRRRDGFPKPVILGKSTVRYNRSDIEAFLRSGGFAGGAA